MFTIGFGEILLILILAVILIGPKQLPDVVQRCGKLFSRVKKIKALLAKELSLEDTTPATPPPLPADKKKNDE